MTIPAVVSMRDPAWLPSPKAKLLWAINAALSWLPLFGLQAVWAASGRGDSRTHVLVFCASLVLAAVHIAVVPFWRYRVHRWEISDTAVHTRTGWFTQESRVAPLSRLQTVDTERGPVDRLLGLASVTITTASSAGAVTITALEQGTADRTVARLTEIAAAHQGDAT